jgi:hypothetical protein
MNGSKTNTSSARRFPSTIERADRDNQRLAHEVSQVRPAFRNAFRHCSRK